LLLLLLLFFLSREEGTKKYLGGFGFGCGEGERLVERGKGREVVLTLGVGWGPHRTKLPG